MLSRLPTDVLILNPDRNHKVEFGEVPEKLQENFRKNLQDKMLYELNFEESLSVNRRLPCGAGAGYADVPEFRAVQGEAVPESSVGQPSDDV